MAVERDIDALFKMCEDLQNEVYNLNNNIIYVLKEEIEDLKALVTSLLSTSTSRHIEVKDLKAVVKSLLESNSKKSVAVKEVVENINALNVDLNKALDENDSKVEQLSAEIEEIREHVKSAEVKHKTTVSKIKALETSVKPGRAFSVQTHHFRPQYRYHQFKGPRPRICYNCRKPGHEARNCDKPNPRMDALRTEARTLSVGMTEQEEEICPWEQEYQASLLKTQMCSVQSEICK